MCMTRQREKGQVNQTQRKLILKEVRLVEECISEVESYIRNPLNHPVPDDYDYLDELEQELAELKEGLDD